MAQPRIKSTSVLIGFNSKGSCIYSEILDLSDYYDSEHVCDKRSSIKKLKLKRLRGYLFSSKGELAQEFEIEFDLESGESISRRVRFVDGTIQNEPAC